MVRRSADDLHIGAIAACARIDHFALANMVCRARALRSKTSAKRDPAVRLVDCAHGSRPDDLTVGLCWGLPMWR